MEWYADKASYIVQYVFDKNMRPISSFNPMSEVGERARQALRESEDKWGKIPTLGDYVPEMREAETGKCRNCNGNLAPEWVCFDCRSEAGVKDE